MKHDKKEAGCQMPATTKDTSQSMANAVAAATKKAQGGTGGGSSNPPAKTGRGY